METHVCASHRCTNTNHSRNPKSWSLVACGIRSSSSVGSTGRTRSVVSLGNRNLSSWEQRLLALLCFWVAAKRPSSEIETTPKPGNRGQVTDLAIGFKRPQGEMTGHGRYCQAEAAMRWICFLARKASRKVTRDSRSFRSSICSLSCEYGVRSPLAS